MIRILLVDDQNLVQQGIKSLLERDPEIEVIGTVKDGRSAVMKIKELQPDVVLLDIEMPGMNGITATKYISQLAPQTKVIILSSHEEKKYLTQALMAGAKAYILKSSLMVDLKQSIIAVNNGYSYIESRLLAKIFDPSSLKSSNSKKNHPQGSKLPNVVTRKPAGKARTTEQVDNFASESIPMFPDVVVADAADRTMETASTTNQLDSKVVPKVNLPHSDSVDPDLTLESESNVAGVVDKMQSPTQTSNRLLLPTTVQDSASQLSATVKNPQNSDRQTFMVTVNGKNYTQQIVERPRVAKYKKLDRFWTEKKAQYKPLIERSQSQLAQYQARIMPVLKRWHKKGWQKNGGLVFLGLVTVIIIHLMFA